MLPDFPSLKSKLHHLIMEGVRFEQASSSPLSMVKSHIIHEGNQNELVRDGNTDEPDLVNFITAKTEIEFDVQSDINLSLKEIYIKFLNAANEISKQQHQHFYKEIEQVCDETGNSVDIAENSIQELLKVLEKMDFSFDSSGNWNPPVFIAGEKAAESIRKILTLTTVEDEQNLKQLVDRKREEWNARENNRKLVG